MSYLGHLRINFAGTFQADVATTNNIPQYYDNALFEPRYRWRMRLPDINGAWNPRGTNNIRFTDVRVTGAGLADGTMAATARQDPVVGARLVEDDLRTTGRLVDLDPQYQFVPEIWGLRLTLRGEDGKVLLRGDFLPAAMEDLWLKTLRKSGRPDPAASYHSVLTGVSWADDLRSPVLRMLRDSTAAGLLSIKLNTDSVEDGMDFIDNPPDNTTFGHVAGAIGPYADGEPKHFVAARRLRKAPGTGPLNHAPCRLDPSGTAFVDLGNGVPTTISGGPLQDVGPLRLALLPPGQPAEPLASLVGVEPANFDRTGGIATAHLSAAQLARAAEVPLAVLDAAGAVLLAESPDGLLVRSDNFVFRMAPAQPENQASTTFTATRFGRPAAGVDITVGTGTPSGDLTFAEKLRTDAAGRAVLTMTAHAPANPRPFVDGVFFNLPYGPAAHPGEPEGSLSVRVFEDYRVPDRPTWVRDVQPIFQQYANLYPVMRDILDLGNYGHVMEHRTYLRRTLLAPRESPNHMPVSRDLSTGKRDMIVKWLDMKPMPPILQIDTRQDLQDTLQLAMLVEQATIPPYLAALMSIRPDCNREIAALIRGVVLEEMQHLVQVANVLNAVGGVPRIGRPGTVPVYPGKLPGPVLPDLQVTLRRLSLEQVRDVFMAIEQPQHPMVGGKPFRGAVIDPRSVRTDRGGTVIEAPENSMRALADWFNAAEYTPMTIGWFYNQIARAIIRLDQRGGLFTGAPDRQVSWPDAPGVLYRVTDRRSALLGIYKIIEQGEGSPHDLDGDNVADPNELGHYYRFEEIVRGRALVRTPQGWKFEGAPIPFDPAGVYPVANDADTFRLPAGSVPRRESEACDRAYTAILTSLNRVFNGHPGELDDAVGLMYALQVAAKKLYDMPSPDGSPTVIGPAFQSPGVTL